MSRPPTRSTWKRLRLRVPEEAAEDLGVACIELGATGTVTDQRDLRRQHAARPGRRRRVWFEAYFPPGLTARVEGALQRAIGEMAEAIELRDPSLVRLEGFPLPDYTRTIRAHFPPIPVGRRLFVCPPWTPKSERSRARAAGRETLVIDPGQAFGTGHHSTTRGCLVAIERAMAAHPPRRTLDVGSGSGILAVAMARLGAQEIVAVDTDPVACAATARTATENGVTTVRTASRIELTRGRFDLIVANLFADLLIDLAPKLARRLATEGTLVVAGLLATQERAVTAALREQGLVPTSRQARSGWVILSLSARARPTASRRRS